MPLRFSPRKVRCPRHWDVCCCRRQCAGQPALCILSPKVVPRLLQPSSAQLSLLLQLWTLFSYCTDRGSTRASDWVFTETKLNAFQTGQLEVTVTNALELGVDKTTKKGGEKGRIERDAERRFLGRCLSFHVTQLETGSQARSRMGVHGKSRPRSLLRAEALACPQPTGRWLGMHLLLAKTSTVRGTCTIRNDARLWRTSPTNRTTVRPGFTGGSASTVLSHKTADTASVG